MARDARSITRDWQLVAQTLIDGVVVHEVKNVPTSYGYLTEIYRSDWPLDGGVADQVFQSILEAGGISAWHAHGRTTDRLFVTQGRMRVVLFDARSASPTSGAINVFVFGTVRPALIVIPPRVWHGVENLAATPSVLVNIVDRAYRYDQPDHYRLPLDSDAIPYRFRSAART
jgi:dTDP-4-dehydrorhamnose 3,5-epimerase